MATNPTGAAGSSALRPQFDCSVKLEVQGSSLSLDGGLLLHRELDDALGLTDIPTSFMPASLLGDPRSGMNCCHNIPRSCVSRPDRGLAGYDEINDADRRCR